MNARTLDPRRRAGQAAVRSIDDVKEPGGSEGRFPSGSFGKFAPPRGEKNHLPRTGLMSRTWSMFVLCSMTACKQIVGDLASLAGRFSVVTPGLIRGSTF